MHCPDTLGTELTIKTSFPSSTENHAIEHQIEKANEPTSSQSAPEQFSITLVW